MDAENKAKHQPSAFPGCGYGNGPACLRTVSSNDILHNGGKGEGKSSDEVLKALRSGLQPEDLSAAVKAIRIARKGGLLIEFEGSVKNRSILGNKITESAGGDVEVRHLVPTTTVVIDGLNAATTIEEVKEALRRDIGEGVDGFKVTISNPINGEPSAYISRLDSRPLRLWRHWEGLRLAGRTVESAVGSD
ncbi:unnamed protein product [Parnassius apollo]|uniref:(apollo) hypothetical protein n=1 Tax=Parnassius apollo TaxID=110799 RepID=A0A8S3WAN7_PARAO|nr:unnamed protein product [Parnassius apollo]